MNDRIIRQSDPLPILYDRFGHDALISLATIDGSRPAVRIEDSYCEDGVFVLLQSALVDVA